MSETPNEQARIDAAHRVLGKVPVTFSAPIPRKGGERVVATYRISGGRPIVTRLQIDAADGDRVSARLLRSLAEDVEVWVEEFAGAMIGQMIDASPDVLVSDNRERRRRRTWDDALLERVTEAYLGGGNTPRRAVERALQCSPATASRGITRARERGFLPPADTHKGDN
jgi:hypothetical protein